jgi:NAD(P)-dependent dehydrogenase (short-subunit alcohol dehydrogenase family)
VTLRARWVTLRASLGDVKSSLGDAESSLGDAKSSLGDVQVPTDITDPADVAALAATVCARYDSVDVLINNAGVCCSGPFADTTMEDWAAQVRRHHTCRGGCACVCVCVCEAVPVQR